MDKENESERASDVSDLDLSWNSSSQSTQSNNENVDDSLQINNLTIKGAFKLYPNLSLAFEKLGYDSSRNQLHKCKGCAKQWKTNRLSSMLQHGSNCTRLEPTVRGCCKQVMLSGRHKGDESHMKLASIIVKNNIPLTLVECPEFREFLRTTPKDWTPSTRREYSEIYIPRLASKATENFYGPLSKDFAENYIVEIEFDHWETGAKQSVLGIAATKPENIRYLLHLEDVSLLNKSAIDICPSLLDNLKRIPPLKVNAVISDQQSGCYLARKMLIESPQYYHVIQHRCIAHFLNRMGNNFTESYCIRELMETANEVATFLNRNSKFSAMLSAAGVRRVKKATSVRWYSSINMLESLVAARGEMENFFGDPRNLPERESSKHTNIIDNMLRNNQFWADTSEVISVMRPLADCIAVSERSDGSVGEAIAAVLEYGKLIFNRDWTENFNLTAVISFITYFNSKKLKDGELGLCLAAYYLDRRNNRNYLTKSGEALVWRAICEIAVKSNITSECLSTDLYQEFQQFRRQEGTYGNSASKTESARKWWASQPDLSPLKTIALRLANLRSSSANLERMFSVLKIIQGSLRNSMSLHTLTSIGRAKIENTQEKKDRALHESMNPKGREYDRESGERESDREPEDDIQDCNSQTYDGLFDHLDPKIKAHYSEFKDVIDFSIVNDWQQVQVPGKKRCQKIDVEEAVKRFEAELR